MYGPRFSFLVYFYIINLRAQFLHPSCPTTRGAKALQSDPGGQNAEQEGTVKEKDMWNTVFKFKAFRKDSQSCIHMCGPEADV